MRKKKIVGGLRLWAKNPCLVEKGKGESLPFNG